MTRRDWDKARRVPAELRAEIARTAGLANGAWIEARQQSKFELFAPHLQKTIELQHRYVECFEESEHVYDVLLDDYEPGMTTAEVRRLFDELKQQGLVPLIAAVAERGRPVDDVCLRGHFPAEQQRAFVLSILGRFGFQPDSWRLDPTVHPFASSSATTDIRITTRYYEDTIGPALFGSMHECGHGLYENGISPRWSARRCAAASRSDCTSRRAGCGRTWWAAAALLALFLSEIRAAFPEAFAPSTWRRSIAPSTRCSRHSSASRPTRPPTTCTSSCASSWSRRSWRAGWRVADVPEAWNARMKEYLGVSVPDDAQGALQDIHWSMGYLGYFPTYSLGNIISCQIWEKARRRPAGPG